MSNWKIQVGTQSFDIEVEEHGYGEYSVSVDGQSHSVSIKEADWDQEFTVPPGHTHPSLSRPAPVVRTPPLIERVAPDVKSKPPPAAKPSEPKPAPVMLSGNTIPSPMPGKVVKVHVEPGSVVKAGDPLCVLESMKMENTVSAPRDGKIAKVHVKLGDTPNTGMPIADYE